MADKLSMSELKSTIRRVKEIGAIGGEAAREEQAPEVIETHWVTVTSLTTVGGMYPGNRLTYDSAGVSTTHEAVLLRFLDNATISAGARVGTKYLARVVEPYTDGTMTYIATNQFSMPMCVAFKSGTQTIATATPTNVTYDTEAVDSDSFHSTSSNTHLFTAPATGRYFVSVNVLWAGNATGYRRIVLVNVGTMTIQVTDAGVNATQGQQLTYITSINSGASVYAEVTQTSGGDLNINGSEFHIYRIV